jgi:hypothetical protein
LKKSNTKRTDEVVQVVEGPTSKHEPLSSNCSATIKTKQKKNKEINSLAYQENITVNEISREGWTQC